MATRWSPKDPQDVRDYWIDFSSLLAADETLTAATVTVPDELLQPQPDPPYAVLGLESSDPVGQKVVARFSGGIPSKYGIDYHVTTSTGQEFDLTKTLEVKERTA